MNLFAKNHSPFLSHILILLLFTLLVGVTACTAAVPSPTATSVPAPTAIVDRLGPPPISENPTQIERGHYIYYQVCMACHGDHGQGLTDEWRAAWGGDSYCWESKCHGANHPPQGFDFPKVSSPVIGPGTLTRFDNAHELHDYLVDTMPWWNPGYLMEEEYWQLTAYLMDAHKALPEEVILSAGNARVFTLRPAAPLIGDLRPQVLFVSAFLALSAGLLAIQDRLPK